MKYQCKQLSCIKCDLGVGLIWNSHTDRLLMSDILKGELIEVDIDSYSNRYWKFKESLAWVLPTSISGKYLLGLKSGIALFDFKKPDYLYWVNRDFPGVINGRLNDVYVDATGRIWYGSMNMDTPWAQDGRLASFTLRDGVNIHDDGFTVTNGPVISRDSKFLFLNDTLQGTVYRYRLDMDSGKLSDRQVFIKFSVDQGYPDGMCFDVEGNLWIALWGGASIVQFDSTGNLLRKIPIPALNVTNLCFCGPGFERLVVSTSAMGLSEKEAWLYPASGALFEIFNHGSVGSAPYLATLDPSWT